MVFDNGWRQQVPWNVSTLLSDYKVTSNNTAVFNTTLVARMKFEIIHQSLFLKCQDNKHLCIFITVDFIVWKYVVCNKTLLSFSEVKKNTILHRKGRQVHKPLHNVAVIPACLYTHQVLRPWILCGDLRAVGQTVIQNLYTEFLFICNKFWSSSEEQDI